MPRGVADVLQIVVLAARPHATLCGSRPPVGPLLLAQEHVLELDHAGIGEQQGGIVRGHERTGRHHFMPLGPKKYSRKLWRISALVIMGSKSNRVRRGCSRVREMPAAEKAAGVLLGFPRGRPGAADLGVRVAFADQESGLFRPLRIIRRRLRKMPCAQGL